MVAPNSIDGNVSGLSIAEEVLGTPKILPGTPDWYAYEPNSFSNTGAVISQVARSPISENRQNLLGTTTGIEVAAGFNIDVTQNNMNRLFQGFFMADALEHYSIHPLNGTANPATSVGAGTGVYNVTTTLASLIRIGDLVKTSKFTNSVNNTLAKVTNVVTTALTTDNSSSVSEPTPPATSNIQVVGFEFDSGDLVATVVSNKLVLTSSAKDMTELGLRIGEFIFIGGDAVGTRFAAGYGYARVKLVTTTQITLDKAIGLTVADAGVGKTIRIFFGTFYRNAILPADIKKRSYQLEQQLGNDGSGVQSRLLTGGFANEFNLKVPAKAKLEADLSFVCMNQEERGGATGIKSGNRIPVLGEEAYNTSSDLYQIAMNVIDGTLTPAAEFAFVSEFNLKMNNGVKPENAVGVIGAFDISLDNFVVSGSVTAYFSTLAAITAIRANTDVTLHAILAKHNGGLIYDIPALRLGGGNLNIQKNAKITVPLEQNAGMCEEGYTLGLCNMHYLPNIAMPVAQ